MAEAENQVATVITPALSKDVAFTEKINAVDTSLKTRAAALKKIKLKWADVVKLMIANGDKAPARRYDPVQAVNMVSNIVVYKPEDERLKDRERVHLAQQYAYDIRDVAKHRPLMAHLETKFKGIGDELDALLELSELANMSKEVDDAATKSAQKTMQDAVDAYLVAIEEYDETVEQVADVKEYISVVKDVAEISAIAQGTQLNPNQK